MRGDRQNLVSLVQNGDGAGEDPVETISSHVDRWIELLDGRVVRSGREYQRLRVLGMYVDGEALWIQVARDARTRSTGLLLHVQPHATTDDVLAAIAESPMDEYRIDVAHAA